jgi:hypothetical protein
MSFRTPLARIGYTHQIEDAYGTLMAVVAFPSHMPHRDREEIMGAFSAAYDLRYALELARFYVESTERAEGASDEDIKADLASIDAALVKARGQFERGGKE